MRENVEILNLSQQKEETIWWKSKILLYGYRQFHCMHNKWYLSVVETRFDTSNYETDKPLPKGIKK